MFNQRYIKLTNATLNKNVSRMKNFNFLDDYHVSCENGQMISTFGEFCDGCPLSTFSEMVLKSNCSKSLNQICPFYYTSLKICMDKVNVSISEYCSIDIENAWTCPNANDGHNFEQCYDT